MVPALDSSVSGYSTQYSSVSCLCLIKMSSSQTQTEILSTVPALDSSLQISAHRCLSWSADFFKMGRSSTSVPLVKVLNTTPSSSLTVNWRDATLGLALEVVVHLSKQIILYGKFSNPETKPRARYFAIMDTVVNQNCRSILSFSSIL